MSDKWVLDELIIYNASACDFFTCPCSGFHIFCYLCSGSCESIEILLQYLLLLSHHGSLCLNRLMEALYVITIRNITPP